MTLLKAQNLSYHYPETEEIHFPDFEITSNALIYGPSGVGKTTLLHLISGLKTIQKGNLVVFNTQLSGLNASEIDAFRTKHIGIVYQKSFFLSSLSVLQNVMLPSEFQRSDSNIKEKAIDLLDRFGIADKLSRKVYTLSQGEQQRVSAARAFLNHPKLVVADEPSSSLDDKNCKILIDQILKISEDFGSTFVVVSHDNRLSNYFNQKIQLV